MSNMELVLDSLPDRFEVLHRIGQGGMAAVYLAHDSQVEARVALKVLLPHLRENALVVERFRREIASDSADEVEGLLRAKILLTEQLQELDGKHREVSLLTSQLLELSSRLSTLAAEIEGQERMDEASLTSMSLILRELNSDLEAQQEIDELG